MEVLSITQNNNWDKYKEINVEWLKEPIVDAFDPENIENIVYSSPEEEIVIIDDYIRDAFSTKPPTPPIRTCSRKKPLLVLDLDETLVHTTHEPIKNREHIYLAEFNYYVHQRPFLEYFLHSVADYFDIGIWSSGTDNYVDIVVNRIMPKNIEPIFVFGRSMCQYRNVHGFNVYVKPLRILEDFGYNLRKMLIIDDSPEKCVDNFKNAIIPKPFYCDNYDSELLDLFHYLESVYDSSDFTNHSHYQWKSFVAEN